LDHDEAFGALIAACQDGTDVGLQDEIVIRLGLLGLRAGEIVTLTWGDISTTEIRWTGKGRKPRQVVPGPRLLEAVGEHRRQRVLATGSPPSASLRIVCRRVPGGNFKLPRTARAALRWDQPATGVGTIWRIVTYRAALAGLGHVTPHDLRRTAAGLLHRATTDDGAHHFDLLDIQQVLGHSDPATTMRSYLAPLDRSLIERAATVLD
jgi:integrase